MLRNAGFVVAIYLKLKIQSTFIAPNYLYFLNLLVCFSAALILLKVATFILMQSRFSISGSLLISGSAVSFSRFLFVKAVFHLGELGWPCGFLVPFELQYTVFNSPASSLEWFTLTLSGSAHCNLDSSAKKFSSAKSPTNGNPSVLSTVASTTRFLASICFVIPHLLEINKAMVVGDITGVWWVYFEVSRFLSANASNVALNSQLIVSTLSFLHL